MLRNQPSFHRTDFTSMQNTEEESLDMYSFYDDRLRQILSHLLITELNSHTVLFTQPAKKHLFPMKHMCKALHVQE